MNKKPWALLQIMFWLSIFVLISVVVFFNNYKQYLGDHFEKIRCKPWFMPFVGIVQNKVSVVQNLQVCTKQRLVANSAVLTSPVVKATQQSNQQVEALHQKVEVAQKATQGLATNVTSYVTDAFEKFQKIQNVFFYLNLKIKALLDKIVSLFMDLYYALISAFDFTNVLLSIPAMIMKITWGILMIAVIVVVVLTVLLVLFVTIATAAQIAGAYFLALGAAPFMWFLLPIGSALIAYSNVIRATTIVTLSLGLATMIPVTAIYGVVATPLKKMYDRADKNSYCCFSGETLVLLEMEGTSKKMQDVQVGDVLRNGNRVLGKLVAQSEKTDWWLYKNKDYVAAEHLVFEEGSFCKVKDSAYSVPVFGRHNLKRYCLVTSNHVILTPSGLFKDFQETSDAETLKQQALRALKELNQVVYVNPTLVQDLLETGEQGLGLHPNQLISTTQGLKKMIDVSLGEELDEGNFVLGVYTVFLKHQRGIHYRDNWVSYSQILQCEGAWIKAYMMKPTIYERFRGTFGLHFLTTKGHLILHNDLMIRDLAETLQEI